ncbi:MAG: hypothetical protein QNI84_00850 [Henriciella sp.]|nr:hypothetical protein [Henriciella sp.]
MNEGNFQTFMVGGLLILIGAVVFLAWSAWRYVDRERDMEKLSLAGVGHELRVNLQRLLQELSDVAGHQPTRPQDLLPLVHPQLDAVLARPGEADRRALTVIRAAYAEMVARKADIRDALAQGEDTSAATDSAINALIDGLATLYLWEEHKGRSPAEAHSTRSWDVRDWMKEHQFPVDALPGIHLRDVVVERLRTYGMALTPKPLTHTAHEYFSMQYDRKADPNAPFWKRKIPKPEPETPETAEVQPSQQPEIVEAEIVEQTPNIQEDPADPTLQPAEPRPKLVNV